MCCCFSDSLLSARSESRKDLACLSCPVLPGPLGMPQRAKRLPLGVFESRCWEGCWEEPTMSPTAGNTGSVRKEEDLGVIWSREKDCKGAENLGFDLSAHVHTMLTLRPLSWVLTGSHWIAPPPSRSEGCHGPGASVSVVALGVRAAGVAEQTAQRVLRTRGSGEAAGAAFLRPPPQLCPSAGAGCSPRLRALPFPLRAHTAHACRGSGAVGG